MLHTDAKPVATVRRRGRPVGSDSVETRNRILRAARRVISERGYPSATFQAIALEADLSRPTLHYYFRSREEIYQLLVDEASAVMSECVAKARRCGTLRDSLSALIAAMHEVDYGDGSQFAFLISARLEASRNPELGYGSADDLRTLLVTLLNDAAARGELPVDTTVEPIVDLVYAMLWGVGLYAGFIKSKADMRLITKQLDQILGYGLLNTAGPTRDSEDTFRDTPSAVGGRP